MFAFDGIAPIMPIENTMKQPEKFLGKPYVALIALSIVTIMYTFIGFFGFARYGEKTEGSITLNLPIGEWAATTGQCLIGIAIICSFGLYFYVPMEILFKKIEHKISSRRYLYEKLIRTGILLCMFGLALVVPDVGQFINLVGGFFSSTLTIFYPALIDTVYCQTHGGFGTLNWKLWKNILLMIFALFVMVYGTILSVIDVVDTYRWSFVLT